MLNGTVRVNDDVELPQLKVTRKVKSMQMFKKSVQRCSQGDRVGILVTQLDAKAIERGILAAPGTVPTFSAAIVAVGSCATYGGLPNADPNPTGAVSVSEIIKDKPIINVPGCPPIPVVISGVLAQFLTFGLPELDHLGRPMAFYGQSIHDRCYRRPFYERGEFAETFDDEGAKKGWCLYKLGCKGPTTYNACATTKWNNGTSWPVEAGHGCIGCSEPRFWDAGGFYSPVSVPDSDYRTAAVAAAVELPVRRAPD